LWLNQHPRRGICLCPVSSFNPLTNSTIFSETIATFSSGLSFIVREDNILFHGWVRIGYTFF
jgi:hypothetical protein